MPKKGGLEHLKGSHVFGVYILILGQWVKTFNREYMVISLGGSSTVNKGMAERLIVRGIKVCFAFRFTYAVKEGVFRFRSIEKGV